MNQEVQDALRAHRRCAILEYAKTIGNVVALAGQMKQDSQDGHGSLPGNSLYIQGTGCAQGEQAVQCGLVRDLTL